MDRKELAVNYKHNGHNCCQSVLCAFSEELNMPIEELDKMGACFGGGMGTMESTCGSLCGAQMILGIKTFEGKPVIRNAASLHKAFNEKCGATICKDLKGRDTGVVLCECDNCVRNAVTVLEEALNL
ncbi:MAG: C-GCAxxG-C-C family protein [Butyrivibrio sp.]|nr:C-GCAxxG-C-C family protein [Butyrivibrio sp.]